MMGPSSHPASDRDVFRRAARIRRVRLLRNLLSVGRPLTGRQLADVVRRDPLLSVARLHSDLMALARLGLVTWRRGMYGLRADWSVSPASRRCLRP
jgi:predicted transcriptional regulator